MQEITESQKNTWILASLAAPAAHVAAGMSWVNVLWVSLLAYGLRGLAGKGKKKTWEKWICTAVCILAAGRALTLMGSCWPKQKDIQWVMLILLGLSGLLAAKGKESAVQGAILLWWLTAFLLGSVLLSSVPEIGIKNLTNYYDRDNTVKLLTILLLPSLAERERKTGGVSLVAMPLAFSICVQGVLSGAVAAESRAPFYELSRSIRLYGVMDRMEALAWLGLMLGTFLYLSFLLVTAGEAADGQRGKRFLIGAAVLIGATLGNLDLERGDWSLGVVVILAGILLPAGRKEAEKIKERNMKKMKENG